MVRTKDLEPCNHRSRAAGFSEKLKSFVFYREADSNPFAIAMPPKERFKALGVHDLNISDRLGSPD